MEKDLAAVVLTIALSLSEMVKHLVGLAANCEDGWQYNPQSDKCYRFYDEEQSWPMSEIYCQFQAAHHVSIHSPQDLAFIQGLAANSQVGSIWVGAAQFGLSKEYENVDKTPFDYENWPYGIRPAYNGGKKCIKMDIRATQWTQSCCKIPAAYVCIKRARMPTRVQYQLTPMPWAFTSTTTSTAAYQYATTAYPYVYRSSQDFRH